MKKYAVGLSLWFLISSIGSAEAIVIDWASQYSDSNAFNPQIALGEPDGQHAMFGNNLGIVRHATYSGFGIGDSSDYNLSGLAGLLGVSEATLAISDFFTVEFNGGGGVYESGLWEFRDGINLFSVDYDIANPGASSAITAFGEIDNQAYADFFGFINPVGAGRNWVYLLFDINGHSNVNSLSSNFSVTLTATDSGGGTDPDPDVMGRIQSEPNPIPEPSSLLLLSFGLLGTGLIKRKFKK